MYKRQDLGPLPKNYLVKVITQKNKVGDVKRGIWRMIVEKSMVSTFHILILAKLRAEALTNMVRSKAIGFNVTVMMEVSAIILPTHGMRVEKKFSRVTIRLTLTQRPWPLPKLQMQKLNSFLKINLANLRNTIPSTQE